MSFFTSSLVSVLSTLNSFSGSSTAAFTCAYRAQHGLASRDCGLTMNAASVSEMVSPCALHSSVISRMMLRITLSACADIFTKLKLQSSTAPPENNCTGDRHRLRVAMETQVKVLYAREHSRALCATTQGSYKKYCTYHFAYKNKVVSSKKVCITKF